MSELKPMLFDPSVPVREFEGYGLLLKLFKDRKNLVFLEPYAMAEIFHDQIWTNEVVNEFYNKPADFDQLSGSEKLVSYVNLYSYTESLDKIKEAIDKISGSKYLQLFENIVCNGYAQEDYKLSYTGDRAYKYRAHTLIFEKPGSKTIKELTYTLKYPKYSPEEDLHLEIGYAHTFNWLFFDFRNYYDTLPLPEPDQLSRMRKGILFTTEARYNEHPPQLAERFPSIQPILLQRPQDLRLLLDQLLLDVQGAAARRNGTGNQQQAYIASLSFRNYFSLQDIQIKGLADKKEVYFLGENGDGKTLVLQALTLALKGNYIRFESDKEQTAHILAQLDENQKRSRDMMLEATLHDGREVFFNYDTAPEDANPDISLYAYGVNRGRNDSDGRVKSGFETLFTASRTLFLESPDNWLKLLYTKDLERDAAKQKNQSPEPGLTLADAIELLKDLIDDDGQRQLEVTVNSDGVIYTERGTEGLRFEQLSEGYRTVMIWLTDLIARLSKAQPKVTRLEDYEAIVLADEVNLHLHPKWEYELPAKLRRIFPRIQWFFTTHSPILLMGASKDAVFYRLYKEEGITRISEPYSQSSIAGLMSNGILTSPLFGLETARMKSHDPDYQDDEYLYHIIHKKISERVAQLKTEGKVYLTQEEIAELVAENLDEYGK